MAVMAKPVLVVVDHEDSSLQALARELQSRYGADAAMSAQVIKSPRRAVGKNCLTRASNSVPLIPGIC